MQPGKQPHVLLLYAAYAQLLLSGKLHFAIEVVGQQAGRKVRSGVERTLYYGLNSAYALSQVQFAVLALLAISQALIILGRLAWASLGFLAALSWLAICVLSVEYWQPRMTVGTFAALLLAAALT